LKFGHFSRLAHHNIPPTQMAAVTSGAIVK
jgi:hypothetical protein